MHSTASDRRVGLPARASDIRLLDGWHECLDMRREVLPIHGCACADGFATERNVQQKLDDAAFNH